MNFNPQYQFNFDSKNAILSLKEKEYVNNVYSAYDKRISNLTVLIGENGTGKTTILRFLLDLKKYIGNFPRKYMAVFLANDNDCNFVLVGNRNISIPNESLHNRILVNLRDDTVRRVLEKEYFIYYTEAFSLSSYNDYFWTNEDIPYNLSVAGRIKYRLKNEEDRSGDLIIKTYHEDTERQIEALDDVNLPFTIGQIRIQSNFLENEAVNLYLQDKLEDSLDLQKRIIAVFKPRKSFNSKEKDIYLSVLFSLLKRMMSLQVNPLENKYNQISLIISQWEKLASHEYSDFEEYILRFVENGLVFWRDDAGRKKLLDGYKYVIKWLYGEYKQSYDEYLKMWKIDISDKKEKEKLSQFYRAYVASTNDSNFSYLKFSWVMSTGEMAFFNMYAQVYHLSKKMKQDSIQSSNVTFMMDEAGLYFHPAWQQECLKRIIDTLLAVFPNKKIQVIIATHSPIFLSDVPRQNVIYLIQENGKIAIDMGKHKETFCANIYTLYQDSFFMKKKDIWIQGTFARDFINRIQKRLSDRTSGNLNMMIMNEIKNEINLIGEEYLRKILRRQWTAAYNKIQKKKYENMSEEFVPILEEFKGLSSEKRDELIELLKKNDIRDRGI